jgi:predicted Zn-dependent protease
VSWSRRDFLSTLGLASGSAIMFACGAGPQRTRSANAVDPEIRTWLKEAVAVLVGAGFERPHALAVSRKRTTGAIDVLGAGVGRSRCDGVVLGVREKSGLVREQVTNDLSRDGVLAAVKVLTSSTREASVDFGRAPAAVGGPTPDPASLGDNDMLARVGALVMRDRGLSSRIVYAAATIDVDDAHVWSVAPGRVLEQRLVRVRRSLVRVAWHGSRPFVSEATRAWSGGIDAQDLTDEEIAAARDNALALLTPTAFENGERGFVLEPAIAAALIDASVRTLLTSEAQKRPDVAKRAGKPASELVTLVDDPTISDAYGGFRFDDSGTPATPVTLIDRGRVVGRIERARRPGHVGRSEVMPSHLRLAAGTESVDALLENGMVLEGHTSTLVDPSSDRFVIQVARARERLAGRRTGRMFADIELVGELTKVVGSLAELSKETRTIGIRDEVDGQPRHRSIETPWLVGTGLLRQRRRPT